MVFVLFTLSGLVEVFCVQESKIGSEGYMSGCRQKKSDLKPKHFCARIKKNLKPQISVCKSNYVTGAAAPISRRQVTTKWFHAEFPSFLRFE